MPIARVIIMPAVTVTTHIIELQVPHTSSDSQDDILRFAMKWYAAHFGESWLGVRFTYLSSTPPDALGILYARVRIVYPSE